MWAINETFEDIGNFHNKSSIHLNPDKIIDPYHIEYPILWTGFVNSIGVIVKQLSESSYSITDYEFVEFPAKYDYLKSIVIKTIDSYLRILD